MAEKIRVTRAQKLAAQSLVARGTKSGKSAAINKIANATAVRKTGAGASRSS